MPTPKQADPPEPGQIGVPPSPPGQITTPPPDQTAPVDIPGHRDFQEGRSPPDPPSIPPSVVVPPVNTQFSMQFLP